MVLCFAFFFDDDDEDWTNVLVSPSPSPLRALAGRAITSQRLNFRTVTISALRLGG